MKTVTVSHPIDTDVLIVGAGPTGLALATMLARAGVKHVIVDKLATGRSTSRAAVIHAHTLEVLEQIGVSNQLVSEGLKLSKFSLRDRDRVLAQLRFDALPSPYAHLLMLPQDRTEKILLQTLANAGTNVRWGCTVDCLVETPEGVVASMRCGDSMHAVRARYVVGADGMHSIVRVAAGIGFTGGRYEESCVLADVDMNWRHGREEVMLFFSPAGLVVVAPLPGDRFRIVATLDEAPEHPTVADVQALLDARGPTRDPAEVSRVHWSSRFRLHHRVADHYRSGRYLLIGDAAHVHSPAGGQGMNTGLVDACVLGRMLADVLAGRRDDSYLDTYEALRRPAAKQVLRLAGRLTAMATMKSAPGRFVRNLVLTAIGHLPPARHKLQMDLSGLSRRRAAAVFDSNARACEQHARENKPGEHGGLRGAC
jgi:2-polyprenyl-6-methoxyphenol hydroxylase-like FAD-dependent oxidoreductase